MDDAKRPPHSPEAEMCVIGSILIDSRKAIPKVNRILKPDDFYFPRYQVIMETALECFTKHTLVDRVTMLDMLPKNEGYDMHLAECQEAVVSVTRVEHYAKIVKKHSQLRQMTAISIRTEAAIEEGGDDAQAIANEAIAEMMALFRNGAHKPKRLGDIMAETINYMDSGFGDGIPTGFVNIDKVIGGLRNSEYIVIAGRPSMGKAQPLDAKIKTLTGWKTMGDLKIGDELASVEYNDPSIVDAIYPQGEKDIYEFEFSDGRKCQVCDEHLWEIYYRDWRSPKVLSTAKIRDMISKKRYVNRLWIRHCRGYFGHSNALPIDPWVLGALLGDGNFTNATIRLSNPNDEIINGVAQKLSATTELTFAGGCDYRLKSKLGPNYITEQLKLLGLLGKYSHEKFVPEIYKTANRAARVRMLMGILDTDGWVESWGSVRFCTTSERLADDVVELCRSIGCSASKKVKLSRYTYKGETKNGRPAWVLNISHTFPHELFSVTHKIDRLKKFNNVKMPVIKSIKHVGKKQAQCISVTHPSNLYITDDYIVTHNTALAWDIAVNVATRGIPVGFISYEMSSINLGMRVMKRRPSGAELTKLSDIPLYVNDSSGRTVVQFISHIFELYHEQECRVFFVDYLQLMHGNRENRNMDLTIISASIKDLAKELDVPLVVLSQLSRDVEKRADKRPTMADLRDSGSIEQDADLIMFVYREAQYRKNDPDVDQKLAEILIEKQRNGQTGKALLNFNKEITAFSDRDSYHAEPPENGKAREVAQRTEKHLGETAQEKDELPF